MAETVKISVHRIKMYQQGNTDEKYSMHKLDKIDDSLDDIFSLLRESIQNEGGFRESDEKILGLSKIESQSDRTEV